MDEANVTWKEIDLLIDCSTSRHQPIPCNGAILQSLFLPESDGVPVMDIHGTCLGFMLALNVVNALFSTGMYQRILLVVSESTLAAANWNEPEGSTLLSDGAAALVLQKREPTHPIYFQHETYSKHLDECQVMGGGHSLPAFEFRSEERRVGKECRSRWTPYHLSTRDWSSDVCSSDLFNLLPARNLFKTPG